MKKHIFLISLAVLAVSAQARVEIKDNITGLTMAGHTSYVDVPACKRAIANPTGTLVRGREYICRDIDMAPLAPPVACAAAPAASTASTSRSCLPTETGGPVVTTTTTTFTRGAPPACALTTATSTASTGTCTPIVTPPVDPPPAGRPSVYVSSTGSSSNPGTQAAPKTQASVYLNTLAAGTTVYFKRGDTFAGTGSIINRNATDALPITLDAYGEGAPPRILARNGFGVHIGWGSDNAVDGSYVIRNLKIDGDGTGMWGLFAEGGLRAVTVENVEITGFDLGIHSQNGALSTERLSIRNSNIHHNRGMGMLGDAMTLEFEGNTFANNNFSGSALNHGTYVGGHGRFLLMRGNTYIDNSLVNGVCLGGNVTVHGQWEGALIENNTISVPAARDSCYGFSITDGYNTPEWFRNFVVRNNKITGVGLGITARGAPGILIEGNTVRNTVPGMNGIVVDPPNGSEDDRGANATARNNVLCAEAPFGTTVAVRTANPSATGTVMRTGAEATTGACAR